MFLLAIEAGIDAGFHGSGLICNRCHTIHYSENGNNGGSYPTTGFGPDGTYGADPEGPFAHLLIRKNSSALCLLCHDNYAYPNAPDVLGDDDFKGLGEERAAGRFDNVDFVDLNTTNPNGHNLAGNKVVDFTIDDDSSYCGICHSDIAGGFNERRIGCLDCHDPHGHDPGTANYSYRNLVRGRHVVGPSKIKAFVNPGIENPIDAYKSDNIGYVTPASPVSDWREVTNVCLACHHRFSGWGGQLDGPDTRLPENEHGICIRHPNTESERGAWEAINKHTGGTDPAFWFAGSGDPFDLVPGGRLPFIVSEVYATDYSTAVTPAENNQVFCLSCHKPHGSERDSAMRWDYRNGSNLGCQQCHNKGS